MHCIYVGHKRKERLSGQRTETNNKANYIANCYRKHNCCIADNLHIKRRLIEYGKGTY